MSRPVARARGRLRHRGLLPLRPAACRLPPAPIRWVLARDPAGGSEPQAFLSTGLAAAPGRVLGWFVSRWRMEPTFQEVRTHLGVETQRQWSDLAILRTTPALLGLFSLVAVWADKLARIPTGAGSG